jgi:hypothetical protein
MALAACAGVSTARLEPPARQAGSERGFYVMLPPNGRYGRKLYSYSGESTNRTGRQALVVSRRFGRSGGDDRDARHGVAACKTGQPRYVFQATILHWEDRSTEWSGRRDNCPRFFGVRRADGTTREHALMDGNSNWATFWRDHPQICCRR